MSICTCDLETPFTVWERGPAPTYAVLDASLEAVCASFSKAHAELIAAALNHCSETKTRHTCCVVHTIGKSQ